MRVAVFDTHAFELEFLKEANRNAGHDLVFFETRLSIDTVSLAFGFDAVCVFVNDCLDADVLSALHVAQIKLVALRAAGFNRIDLEAAERLGIRVVRVPQYSLHAVAEHALGLMLCLDRKLIRAHQRVREGNFSLEGLIGFELHGKTVGVIGTGRIGSVLVRILSGFGCRVLANDLHPKEELLRLPQVEYADFARIYAESDIISLHVPLTPETFHLLDSEAFDQMKKGVMIINTGRGALIDTKALIQSLKNGKVGYAGLDVYEVEDQIFFKDLSEEVLQDDQIARLMTFPNVLITAHQGFLTREALKEIARITVQNLSDFEQGKNLSNELCPEDVVRKAA